MVPFLECGYPTIAGVLIAFCVPAKPVYAPKNYIKTIRKNIGFFASEDDEKFVTRTILNKGQLNWLKEIESASDKVISPLQDMEDSLHPIVNYLIVPLFAFANAGIFFGDLQIGALFHGVAPAIIVGLVAGKFYRYISVFMDVCQIQMGTDAGRVWLEPVGGSVIAWRHRVHSFAVHR